MSDLQMHRTLNLGSQHTGAASTTQGCPHAEQAAKNKEGYLVSHKGRHEGGKAKDDSAQEEHCFSAFG